MPQLPPLSHCASASHVPASAAWDGTAVRATPAPEIAATASPRRTLRLILDLVIWIWLLPGPTCVPPFPRLLDAVANPLTIEVMNAVPDDVATCGGSRHRAFRGCTRNGASHLPGVHLPGGFVFPNPLNTVRDVPLDNKLVSVTHSGDRLGIHLPAAASPRADGRKGASTSLPQLW